MGRAEEGHTDGRGNLMESVLTERRKMQGDLQKMFRDITRAA